MKEQFLWVEKFRPKKISDIILPKELKIKFNQIVAQGEIPNLLLTGNPGMGKTTVARALCEEMGVEFLFINGSKDGNIDTLRGTIQSFASSLSFDSSKRKCVIYDEFDYSNINSTQPALRGMIEEFSHNCSFIFTANHPERILDPLKSRFQEVRFTIPKEERKELILEFIQTVSKILSSLDIRFEKKIIAAFILEKFPDMRKCLVELQGMVVDNEISPAILSLSKGIDVDSLYEILKSKKYNDLREWVVERDVDFGNLINEIYTVCDNHIENESIPDLILILNNYQYKHNFALNKEVNILAMLTEIILTIKFK